MKARQSHPTRTRATRQAPPAPDAAARDRATADRDRMARALRPSGMAAVVDEAPEREADAIADRIGAGEHAAPPAIRALAGGARRLPEVVRGVLREPGRPLDRDTRAYFEPRLGHSLGEIRIHTGDSAAAAARAVGALAFTTGRDVVFGAGQLAPGTRAGDRLLAHELTHVAQQPAGGAAHLRRQADPKSPSQLRDPIELAALPGYGFWAIGPEYTGQPQEVDVRLVLAETGAVDAAALAESTAVAHRLVRGDLTYLAYVHPSLGVIARAYSMAANPGQPDPHYSVYAYLRDQDATKYRPVGGSGMRRPIVSLDAMTGIPAVRLTELHAGLRLAELRLAALAAKYPRTDPVVGTAIANAQLEAGMLRPVLTADPAQLARIETAVQLLEWVEHDLALIDKQRDQLVAAQAPTTSLEELRWKYGTVIHRVFWNSALESYEEAQRWAERSPIDVTLDALYAHGQLNAGYLAASETLVDWTADLRMRLDRFYADRALLAIRGSDPALARQIADEAAFLDGAVRGIQLYAQRLVAAERFYANRPGVTDLPLIDAMNTLRDRVDALKAAYDKHDTKELVRRVDSLEADEHVRAFYQALPAAMQVTRLIAKIGVTTLAALATGGVGGLLAGGARTVATGITMRGALRFVGTAVLEAATFTGINAAASTVLFGEKLRFGSLLADFAWNLGLFLVLRGVAKGSTAALRAAELEVIAGPVQLAVSFPFAHGWGVLRFRVEQGRWPTSAELDQMTAESILMLAAIAVGAKGVQRFLEARQKATALSKFYREYGWRFAALESLRTTLAKRVELAEASGKGNDAAELAAVKADAKTLEAKFQQVLDTALKDKALRVDEIRKELNALHEVAPNAAAELLAEAIGIPLDVGVRKVGRASYSYSNAKTSALEESLAGTYTTTSATEPATGLKTVTATKPGAPTLIFEERAAGGLELDPRMYDVQKLMLDFSLTDRSAQQMMWRLLSDNGIAKDAKLATTATRKQVKALAKQADKPAEEVLRDLHTAGRLRGTAPRAVVELADRLDAAGITKSAEWLDARGLDNQRGVVGEWLAKEAVPPPAGARVLRRVTAQADVFEDAAGTVPAKDAEGRARINATAAETDLVYGHNMAGGIEVDTVINVKASDAKGMAKSAVVQNANFDAILRSKPGELVKLTLGGATRYARIRSITALEGAAVVDLTGKLTPSATMGGETVGPKGSGGFTKLLAADRNTISAVTEVLAETQLVRSGEY